MSIIYFGWHEFDKAVEDIAQGLNAKGITDEITCIYGIPRGGLVLAVALSHRLSKPIELDLNKFGFNNIENILIVDDISDSGKTFINCCPYARYSTATIHFVKDSAFEPDVWVRERPKDDWIVYPWEGGDVKCLEL